MYKYPISNEKGTGFIEINGDQFKYALGKSFEIRTSYVKSVEKLGDMALNKVKVKMEYYNVLGDLQNVEFIMNSMDLNGLKKTLGK